MSDDELKRSMVNYPNFHVVNTLVLGWEVNKQVHHLHRFTAFLRREFDMLDRIIKRGREERPTDVTIARMDEVHQQVKPVLEKAEKLVKQAEKLVKQAEADGELIHPITRRGCC